MLKDDQQILTDQKNPAQNRSVIQLERRSQIALKVYIASHFGGACCTIKSIDISQLGKSRHIVVQHQQEWRVLNDEIKKYLRPDIGKEGTCLTVTVKDDQKLHEHKFVDVTGAPYT